MAIATALGVGYIPKAPGTFGSLVGVATAVLSAAFFLRPRRIRSVFSFHPLSEAVFSDNHFLVPGSDIHDSTLALPLVCALGLLVIARCDRRVERVADGGLFGDQGSAVCGD